MHSYVRNIGDRRARGAGLTLEGDGLLDRIEDTIIKEEKPIKTQRVFGLAEGKKDLAMLVLRGWFEKVDQESPDDEAEWRSDFTDAVISDYRAKAERNARNGAKGGRPRKGSAEKATAPEQETKNNPVGFNGFSKESEEKPNQEPRTNNHISTSNEVDVESAPRSAPRKKPAALNFYGLPEQLQNDWVRSRGSKKLTQTAIDGVKREAEKAGFSFERAVRMMLENAWQSFYANWDSVQRARSISDIPKEIIDRNSAWSAYIKPWVDKNMRPPLSYDEWLDQYEREHHQGPYRNLANNTDHAMSAEDQYALEGGRA